MAEPWSSVEDIAAHLGVVRETIYRWIEQKGLPAHRIGKFWKFKISEVDEWIRAGDAADGSWMLAGLAAGLAKAGQRRRALEFARTIVPNGCDAALRGVAVEHIEAGLYIEALEAARWIGEPEWRAEILARVGARYPRPGEKLGARARKALREILAGRE